MMRNSTKTSPGESRPIPHPSSLSLWIILTALAVAAMGVLTSVWNVGHPPTTTLWYEVARTSMQVLGVAVIGGIVSVATARYQRKHHLHERELEEDRENMDRRSSLSDRASRCAQNMFATCQHVRRLQAEHSPLPDDAELRKASNAELRRARALLDKTYINFYLDAEALLLELTARYGAGKTNDQPPKKKAHEWWQDIEDLLVIYYLLLCKKYSRAMERETASNEKLPAARLNLDNEFKESEVPDGGKLRNLRDEIREKFNKAMPELTDAILHHPVSGLYEISENPEIKAAS